MLRKSSDHIWNWANTLDMILLKNIVVIISYFATPKILLSHNFPPFYFKRAEHYSKKCIYNKQYIFTAKFYTVRYNLTWTVSVRPWQIPCLGVTNGQHFTANRRNWNQLFWWLFEVFNRPGVAGAVLQTAL